MLTVEDLRWAQAKNEHDEDMARFDLSDADTEGERLLFAAAAEVFKARAARFRAAAEAMEREGKRSG